MFDVLIVEDEHMARESLKYLIDWPAYGFIVHGEAENGQVALEMMKKHHYALVITDIRMPVLNGLELIADIRRFSNAPIVILSGYEDFEYARQGVKMGIQDYLLKPVDEEDLIATLCRISQDITELQRIQRQQYLGISALRDQTLRKWVHGQLVRKEYDELPQLLNQQKSDGHYCCLLVEMDFVYDTTVSMSERDMELKRYAVRNILEELCGVRGWVFEDSEDRYGLLLHGTEEYKENGWLETFAENICVSVLNYAKETVSIGLGNPVCTVAGVAESFVIAEEALDLKFLHGNNSILTVMQPPTDVTSGDSCIRPIQEEVIDALRSCDRELVADGLRRLWVCFKDKGISGGIIRMTVLQFFVQIFQLAKQFGGDPNHLFGKEASDYERAMKVKTMDELLRFTQEKCMYAMEFLAHSKDLQPNKVIGTVIQMIEKNYHRNQLSLRSVAEQVYFNPNYLGKLFKSSTEMSFNDYVLRLRMEKAKELLLYSDKKVYEIAQEVGIEELDWFYKRFKSYTGVSAGEFRAKHVMEK